MKQRQWARYTRVASARTSPRAYFDRRGKWWTALTLIILLHLLPIEFSIYSNGISSRLRGASLH